MNLPSARRALGDSALALVVACAAIAMFLPPLAAATAASLLRAITAALVAALALALHWIFLGAGARRMGQPVVPWIALAVLLFPVGAAAALILLGQYAHEHALRAQPSAAR